MYISQMKYNWQINIWKNVQHYLFESYKLKQGWNSISLQKEWLSLTVTNDGGAEEKEPLLLVGAQTSATTMETGVEIPQESRTRGPTLT